MWGLRGLSGIPVVQMMVEAGAQHHSCPVPLFSLWSKNKLKSGGVGIFWASSVFQVIF